LKEFKEGEKRNGHNDCKDDYTSEEEVISKDHQLNTASIHCILPTHSFFNHALFQRLFVSRKILALRHRPLSTLRVKN
jgi:hypothetical protein